MGGKDLNLKKSWHVNLMSNQKKVWQAEQSALDERKKIEQLRREREEERAMEEIAKLQEAAGGRTKANRVDWMYQGGANGSTGVTEEQESYLLGKRRVDQLILKKDQEAREALKKDAANGIGGSLGGEASLSGRDLVTKTALDPLMAIEMQKQRAMEEQIERLQRMEKLKSQRDKKSSRHEDGEHRRRRRRHDDDDRRRSRRRDNSRERSRRHGSDSRERRRDRSRSRTLEGRRRSRTPEPRRRSSTPEKRRYRDDSRDRTRQRSRSPREHRRRDDSYERSRRRDDCRDRSSKYRDERREKRRYSDEDRPKREPEVKKEDDGRAARLAAMQANAQDLESDRSKRLAEMADREMREKEIEDAKRLSKSGTYAAGLRREMLQNTSC